MSASSAAYWDEQADRFDDQPDHGLRDPSVRQAWADLLTRLIAPGDSRIADLGCGTGSLAVLLAGQGHRVTGLDASPRMVQAAADKASLLGVDLDLRIGDASAPVLAPASYDVVLARHVVWALPDPATSLRAWVDLLVPGGRLVLVEGHWSTGAGLRGAELALLLAADERLIETAVEPLTDPRLWGGPIIDERYAITSRKVENR